MLLSCGSLTMTLSRVIQSNNNDDSHCLNYLHLLRRKNKTELHIKDTKILLFNQYHKSDKRSAFIYSDLECLILENWM